MDGMDLRDLASAVAGASDGAVVITGPGAFSGALYAEVGERDGVLTNMELAYATALAHGIAIAAPARRVVAVEGDGSIIAALGTLGTIARYATPNLTVVVIVNGIYATGDNSVQALTGLGADLGVVAQGLAWPAAQILRASTADEAAAGLSRALASPGPWLILADVDAATYPKSKGRAKPGIDVVEAAVLLRRHLTGSPT